MEKLIFILLVAVNIVIASNIVLAGVKFGSWDKWDKSLAPLNVFTAEQRFSFFREVGFGEPIFWIVNYCFCSDKNWSIKILWGQVLQYNKLSKEPSP